MQRVPMIADEAVRRYLEALEDPTKAVDWDLVDDLARRIDASDDPVERVRLRGEWRRAHEPVWEPLEQDFIQFAQRWADANGVIGDDFAAEGVPLQILDRAGLEYSDEFRVDELDASPAAMAAGPNDLSADEEPEEATE